jgi:hypothetical protein
MIFFRQTADINLFIVETVFLIFKSDKLKFQVNQKVYENRPLP